MVPSGSVEPVPSKRTSLAVTIWSGPACATGGALTRDRGRSVAVLVELPGIVGDRQRDLVGAGPVVGVLDRACRRRPSRRRSPSRSGRACRRDRSSPSRRRSAARRPRRVRSGPAAATGGSLTMIRVVPVAVLLARPASSRTVSVTRVGAGRRRRRASTVGPCAVVPSPRSQAQADDLAVDIVAAAAVERHGLAGGRHGARARPRRPAAALTSTTTWSVEELQAPGRSSWTRRVTT